MGDPTHSNEILLIYTSTIYSIYETDFRKKEGLQFCMLHFPYSQQQEDMFISFVSTYNCLRSEREGFSKWDEDRGSQKTRI